MIVEGGIPDSSQHHPNLAQLTLQSLRQKETRREATQYPASTGAWRRLAAIILLVQLRYFPMLEDVDISGKEFPVI
ncbi:hypothetical protein AVEN_51254-1 [Araneus ventricosus]|uniref:Uncharacterized protein n=1 Tax=Araneus ventricosus TaxID=182803 RepID=A0A4Y2U5X1_ARAVE|nr:hypothetical protein AVEN_51254-1 [Araneus ventricosus]